ncbi:helix-turn-helix domain-containing protein [Candidatus Caldatribacterium saccharofermentans]
MTGLGKNQTYRLFRRADFPAKRLGRSWFVSRAAFERWLEQRGDH